MKKLFVSITIVLFVVLIAQPTITALAWNAPVVTPLCAPDDSHFSFNVYLTSESDYNMDWYWDSTGSYPKSLHAGDNTVTVPRGTHSSGDTWFIRWHSDPGSFGSATANGTLCHQSHTVTWATNADCTGWNATYSIDGAATVVYDSGTWSNPYILETASPKAFTVPEIPGDTYDYPNAPNVTVNEPAGCQQTHTVTYGFGNSCNGWNAWYSIDGGNLVIYASGSWSQPFVLEVANVPAEDIPTIAGQLYDNPHKDGFVINESRDCHATHRVTWATNANCTGWIATYSIDGAAPVVYDSGMWRNPYVLESANPKAFTIPTAAGEVYDHPNSPNVTVNEPERCLITLNHNHSLTPASDCYSWSVTPSSSDGGIFTPNGALSGNWTDLYSPESVTLTGTWDWPDGYGIYDSVTINKDSICIVNLNHNALITVVKDCTGWSASFSSSDGGVGTPTTPTSGVWIDPYSLEHATVSYHVAWPDGYATDISKTVDEPDNCLHAPVFVPPPTQKIGLAMLICTDGSLCYDQGLDGVCWIKYSLEPGQMFSTANAVQWCDLGPGQSYNPDIMRVYHMDDVFLGYPYTKMCWGPDDKGNCAGDLLLAQFNKDHGTHYMYGWLFPGYGGH